MSNKRKDIWTLAKEHKEREKKNADSNTGGGSDEGLESTIVVVGNKSSGKTALINRLRGKDDPPQPTVALEYRYARSTRGTVKDVCHIWELAGGSMLGELLDIPINESNIHTTTFVIVVDLSEPADAIKLLEVLLNRIEKRVKSVLDGLDQRGSKRPRAMKHHATKKYGNEHPDLNSDVMQISPVPIVIAGSNEKRKLVCKFLRYIAHTCGASLLFTSSKEEILALKLKKLLSHHAFRSSALQECTTDHNKPLCIMAGQDTLSQIGLPPSLMNREAVGRQAIPRYEQWRADFDRYFPQKSDERIEELDFLKFPEALIDSIRSQKDKELDRLRNTAERKLMKKDEIAELIGLSLQKKDLSGGSSKSLAKSRPSLNA
ncbi:Cytoplasmic dynein 2 light intermediate chain 1 [Chytridiales sp. JEL 0842]|nr:Cytoplasmic dynein 2 light intermediate chain 1 [Chytridiales sp. JEL 0842]